MFQRLPLLNWALVATTFIALLSGCSDGSSNNTTDCTTRADCAEGERCDANGSCTSTPLACSNPNACDFGDYCLAGSCADATCAEDSECTDAVCVNQLCRPGCVDDDACGDGKTCNPLTRICQTAGCTTGTCAQFQSCETQDAGADKCEYNGDCNNDAVCAAYAQQLGDGNEYICSTAQQRCVIKPECGTDNDCVLGEICEPRASDARRVCRRGCRENAECGSGQVCAVEQGSICVDGCDSDTDCTGEKEVCSNLVCIETCTQRSDCTNINLGYICTGNPRICQGCTDSSQCPSTQFCDFEQGNSEDEATNPSVGLCVDLPPTCPTDLYGTNTTLDSAYAVATFPFDPAGDDRPYYCRETTGGDWFKINATLGEVIEAELTYSTPGNLDLALRASDGRELALSDLPPSEDNGKELIRFGTDLGGIFYVQVRGSIIDANAQYGLKINVGAPAACTDDAFEPNDDPLTAPVLPPAVDHKDLEVCGDDPDFYTLEALANQVIRIRASAPPRLGNIDLVLRDSAGAIVAQALTGSSVEEILYTTEAAEDFVLEVRIATGVGNAIYDLEWTQFDNVCTDVFELNNSCNEANTVGAGTYADLAVCADPDYYAFDLLPLQTITVKAIYDPTTAAGDLDITLFGPNDCATFVQSESRELIPNSTAVAETITYQAPTGGRFNILASLFAGINVPYTLDVQIVDGPPCVDDSFEPNDALANAVLIDAAQAALGTDNIITGAKICDANQDWYAIDLAEGDVLRWDVKFSNTQGNLDAFLVGPSGSVIASSVTNNDLESVTYTPGVGEAGTYYLHVEGKFPARADYWVLTYLNGVGPADPACPDDFENNDTAATAVAVGTGSYGLLICGNPVDDDWFSTDLLAGERLTVSLTFPHAQGNVDLILYDDSSITSSAVESRTITDNESVTYLSSRDQTVKWRVFTPTTKPAIPYGMLVDITPAGVCSDDIYEANETAGSAPLIAIPGLYAGLTKCEDNVDWFKFNAVSGRKYEVFLNFINRAANLDVTVYDSTLTAVGQGVSTTDDESVIFTAAAAGVYFIKIESPVRSRLVYDLMLYADLNGNNVFTDAGEGPEDRVCPDDFENNDTAATAKPMPIGTSSNLLLCSTSDPDYYTFFVPAGASLTTNVIFTHSDGDINARIYKGSSLIASGLSTTDNETITVSNTGTSGETYTLNVYGVGTFTSRYNVTSSLAFTTTCNDDMVSSADLVTASGATPITSDAYNDLTLCEGTEDWFRLPAGTTSVDVNLEVNPLLGAITLELMDSTGTMVQTATATGAVRALAANALNGASLYYLRASATGGGFIRNSYDLWVSLNGVMPAAPFCSDAYERNDTSNSAYSLDVNAGINLTDAIACGEDQDWYSVSVFAGQDYIVQTYFDHVAGESDLALEVKDAAGVTLANGTVDSDTSDEFLTFRPTTAGNVTIGVKNVAGSLTETPYIMHASRKLAVCQDDVYEPNNTAAIAKPLANVPAVFPLGSCLGANNQADDYFTFVAPTDGDITVELLFDGSVMNFLVEVRDGGGLTREALPVGGSINRLRYTKTGATQGESFRVYVGSGQMAYGPYFLRIGLD